MKKNQKELYADSRWWDNPKPRFGPCGNCAHYHGFGECDAFSDIPLALLSGEILHDKPYPGDHGIQFTPK